MPYVDTEDGHRIVLTGEVMGHAKETFDRGYQLEAILLAHEYLEQRLNRLYELVTPDGLHTVHRKFKNLIDMLASSNTLAEEDYEVLNEFNRLRNVNSNLVLNSSLTLKGAKKGDMARTMNLAEASEQIISRLSDEIGHSRKKKRKNS